MTVEHKFLNSTHTQDKSADYQGSTALDALHGSNPSKFGIKFLKRHSYGIVMKTIHWGTIGAFMVPIANQILSPICGHSIDISTMSWAAEITSILVIVGGFMTEHLNVGQSTDSTATPAPQAPSAVNALTPDN